MGPDHPAKVYEKTDDDENRGGEGAMGCDGGVRGRPNPDQRIADIEAQTCGDERQSEIGAEMGRLIGEIKCGKRRR